MKTSFELFNHRYKKDQTFSMAEMLDFAETYASTQHPAISEGEIYDHVKDIVLDDISESENNLYLNGRIDGAKWALSRLNHPQQSEPIKLGEIYDALADNLSYYKGVEGESCVDIAKLAHAVNDLIPQQSEQSQGDAKERYEKGKAHILKYYNIYEVSQAYWDAIRITSGYKPPQSGQDKPNQSEGERG